VATCLADISRDKRLITIGVTGNFGGRKRLNYVYYWHIPGGTEGSTKGLTDNYIPGKI
jgi:hypothetical protein